MSVSVSAYFVLAVGHQGRGEKCGKGSKSKTILQVYISIPKNSIPVLIAHWLVVKLRVWYNRLSLRSEADQHLVVSSTHVSMSLLD